jgi:hypothetical protein
MELGTWQIQTKDEFEVRRPLAHYSTFVFDTHMRTNISTVKSHLSLIASEITKGNLAPITSVSFPLRKVRFKFVLFVFFCLAFDSFIHYCCIAFVIHSH